MSDTELTHFIRLESGLTLFCREFPALDETAIGTPILCLPGLTRNSQDFAALAEHLQRRHRVLALDLRGRGRSDHDPNWRNYRLDIYVADVTAALDHFGIHQVIIIGTSLGGLIGMFFGAANPARLRALVLNDIGPELDPVGMQRIASGVGEAVPASSWQQAAEHTALAHAAVLPDYQAADWLAFAKRIYRERDDGLIVRDMDPAIGRALRETENQSADFWSVFHMLDNIPLLALRGELSDLFSAATLAAMQEQHPCMQTAVIARRGHAPTLDEPASRLAIDSFLESLP